MAGTEEAETLEGEVVLSLDSKATAWVADMRVNKGNRKVATSPAAWDSCLFVPIRLISSTLRPSNSGA